MLQINAFSKAYKNKLHKNRWLNIYQLFLKPSVLTCAQETQYSGCLLALLLNRKILTHHATQPTQQNVLEKCLTDVTLSVCVAKI